MPRARPPSPQVRETMIESDRGASVQAEPGGAYQWYRYPRADVDRLTSLGCASPLLAQIVLNRGCASANEAQRFLAPSLGTLHDPLLLQDMDRAVDRLEAAVRRAEPIAIYGDYDVDGLTAASVLFVFLRSVGAAPDVFIPHRERDGYGLNDQALRALADGGARVVVTVDCGITAVQEVARISARGVDVVVTDHHPALPDLPAATAVVNPNQPRCGYPFKCLAGAGVAYKLVQALAERLGTSAALEASADVLDLTALGTMADVVPLVHENRVLVAQGLARIRGGQVRPGIASLARVAGVPLELLTSESLSFGLAPRLNAAGRLDDARAAFDLLVTESPAEADALAEQLQALNVRRQEQTEIWVAEALAEVARRPPRGLALVAGRYPLGIAGIVAARLAEELQLPAIVLNEVDGTLRGSARAPEPFNVVDGLKAAAPLLDRFGGHARAAGLSATSDRLDALRGVLEDHFEPLVPSGERHPPLLIDGLVRPETVGWDTAVALESLEPHGEGNPPALLLWKGVEVLGHRVVGKGHLSMTLRAGSRVTPAIAFLPRLDAPRPGSQIDLVFELRREFWNESWRVAVRARDWRPA